MFVQPRLFTTLRDPRRLGDSRYVGEPKFDGQRAQIHVAGGCSVAAYSRRALPLLAHAGLAWLRDVHWPVDRAVLDGEVCGATGRDGIQSMLEASSLSVRSARLRSLKCESSTLFRASVVRKSVDLRAKAWSWLNHGVECAP